MTIYFAILKDKKLLPGILIHLVNKMTIGEKNNVKQ